MTKLERLERGILIFLITALIFAIAISALRKSRSPVPVKIEKFNAEKYKSTAGENSSSGEKIDINNATAEELEKIKGVGKTLAGRVTEYRYQNGRFSSIDELKNVKGISVALFEKIKTKITAE